MKEVIHRRDAERHERGAEIKIHLSASPLRFFAPAAVKINIIYTHSKLNHYSFAFEFDIACPIP
jgi:hypothetical protein